MAGALASEPVVLPQTWLQKHERMVICALVLAVAMFLGNKYLDSEATRAQASASVATQIATEAKANAQQAAQQAAQTQAQFQAIVETLQKQNAVLAQAVTQRDAILGQTQKVVAVAPLPDVAKEWQGSIGGTGDIVSSTNGLTINESGARRTVEQLVELPVVKADLADETKVAQNAQEEVDRANDLLAVNNKEISALNAEIGANAKQCTADINAAKAVGKKNSVKWFKRGFIVGFVAGLWTSHAAGL